MGGASKSQGIPEGRGPGWMADLVSR